MKKVSLFVCSCLLSVSLISCGETPKDYVKFYNYDGELLWQTEYYPGMILTYGGEEPVRQKDEVYEYNFVGWNHSFEDVKEYRNYYALYDKSLVTFTVIFKDYDGTVIEEVNAQYGENIAIYIPSNPSRPNELRKHYLFSHWDGGDYSYVTSDMVLTAVYDEIDCFEVRYYDYDDTLIKTEYLERGSDSSFDFDNCYEADDDHYYVFNCWDADVVNVQRDMIVKATYRIVNACIVTFLNYDGTLLSTVKVPMGRNAKYNGQTPARETVISGNYKTIYIFDGWDKSLNNVQYSFSTTASFKSDTYNYIYREALDMVIIFCKMGRYEWDADREYMIYENKIDSGYSGTMYEYLSAIYRPYDESCYLYYSLQSISTTPSRVVLQLYLPRSEPGKYGAYYKYYFGSLDTSGLSFFGTTNFTSSFSKYTTSISFEYYTNLGTTTLSSNMETCAGMINSSLTKASKSAFFNSKDLGFINY